MINVLIGIVIGCIIGNLAMIYVIWRMYKIVDNQKVLLTEKQAESDYFRRIASLS